MLLQDGAVATSEEDQTRSRIREHILQEQGYEKDQYPDNEVSLSYDIVYEACPTPDPETGTLESVVRDAQVCATLFFSS